MKGGDWDGEERWMMGGREDQEHGHKSDMMSRTHTPVNAETRCVCTCVCA